MAQFLAGYSDQQMPLPYKFTGVSLWSFPLEARYAVLADLVNKYLSPGNSNLNITPVGSPITGRGIVYMMVLHYDRMISTLSPFDQWGYLTQNEFCFGIPVIHWDGISSISGFFIPYIFVDNPWSMVCGNTVVGFPKQMARFHMPESFEKPYPFEIDAPVFVQHSPTTTLTWNRVVEVNSGLDELAKKREGLWPFGDIDALFSPGGILPVDGGTFDLLARAVSDGAYSLFQLKQIRDIDVSRPDAACYLAVVRLDVSFDSIPSSGPLSPAVIDLMPYASLPIGEKLGLIYNKSKKLSPVGPYWTQCDLSIKDTQVLYPKP